METVVLKEHEKEVKKNGEMVVIDIKDDDRDPEKVCRICKESSPQIISLGCNCKGGLEFSHSSCAAIWFSFKGNRTCEICGATAKNICIIKRSVMREVEVRGEVAVAVEEEEEDEGDVVGERFWLYDAILLICCIIYPPILFYYAYP